MHLSVAVSCSLLLCLYVLRTNAFLRFSFSKGIKRSFLPMSSWTRPSVPSSVATSEGKVYLIIPFEDKDVAKQMGARWDPEAKLWYAMADDDTGLLQRWPSVGSPANAGSFSSKPMDERLPSDAKVYLTVPFSEKDEAKALGARWDKDSKMWYAPNSEPALIQRWGKSSSTAVVDTQPQPVAAVTEKEMAQKSWRMATAATNSDRIYLDVPFEEKDEAKSMGARFCRDRKLWYTTDRNSPLLERWNMKDERRMPQNINHLIPESFDDVEKYTFDDAH